MPKIVPYPKEFKREAVQLLRTSGRASRMNGCSRDLDAHASQASRRAGASAGSSSP